jgi:hypothetical protein
MTQQAEGKQEPTYGTWKRRPAIVRWTLRLLVLIVLLAIGFAYYAGVFNGNVRVVHVDRVYRSATLAGDGFEATTARIAGNSMPAVLSRYHIHTVINLRGGTAKDSWHRAEQAVCTYEGANLIDFSFSAIKLPRPADLKRLLATFDALKPGQYPILIHCRGGADRSGMVCTIYRCVYDHLPLDEAESEELTWRYGHLAFTRTRAMDLIFTLYRQTSHGEDLRKWILTTYPSVYAREPANLKSTGSPGDGRP